MPESVVVALRLIGIAALEIGERSIPLGSGKRTQLLAFVGASDTPVKRDEVQTALWAPDVNQTGLKELLRRLQAETERDAGQALPKLLFSRDDDPAIPVGHLALNPAIVCDAAHLRKQAKRARSSEDAEIKRRAWQQVVGTYEAGGGEFGEGLPLLGGTWDPWLDRQRDELRREYETARAGLESLGGGTIITNLRQGRGRFFGRDDLKQTVRAWAESGQTGVLCLHGPGGVGKTRLSEEACRPLSDLFDLIWLVSFEALKPDTATGQQVASEIALKLGAENVDDAAKRLPEFVRSKGERALLILDNFESADNTDTQKWLAEFAQTGIRCLVTSRKRLTLRNIGDNVSVECLEIPKSPDTDFDALPAVELFRDRLDTEVKLPPYAQLSAEDRAGLVEVLRVTDGFPLAIEIVAANRVHAMGSSLKEIAAGVRRMRYRDELGESGGGAERHESMGACFQWSLDLLPKEEAKRFVTLGVFPFDFGLEAAQVVCGVSADDLTRWWQRSLVQRDMQKPGDRRFLLSLLKEYAWDTCAEIIREDIESKAVDFYANFVKGLKVRDFTDVNQDKIGKLDTEWNSILEFRFIALVRGWYFEYCDMCQIDEYLSLRRSWKEFEANLLKEFDYINRLTVENEEIVDVCRYNIYALLGKIFDLKEELDKSIEYYNKALGIAGNYDLDFMKAPVFNVMAGVLQEKGLLDESISYYKKSLAIYESDNNLHGMAGVISNIADVYEAQGYDEMAMENYNRSLSILRELGDRRGEGLTINNIGNLYHRKGMINDALMHYKQSMEIFREKCDAFNERISAHNAGALCLELGDVDGAMEYLSVSISINKQMGNDIQNGILLELGKCLFANGRVDEALEVFLEARELFKSLDGVMNSRVNA